MKKIISCLTLSLTALFISYAGASDLKSRCNQLKYIPGATIADEKSKIPSSLIVPSFVYCSGKMEIADIDSLSPDNLKLPILITKVDQKDNFICGDITGASIINDEAQEQYLKDIMQGKDGIDFEACLIPRSIEFLAPKDVSVVIGDENLHTRSDHQRIMINQQYSNMALSHALLRHKIAAWASKNKKTVKLPDDKDLVDNDLFSALQGFRLLKISLNEGQTITFGGLLDSMDYRFVFPQEDEQCTKMSCKNIDDREGNEIVQIIAGKYPELAKYTYFNQDKFNKLGNSFTWGDFLDALDIPYVDTLAVKGPKDADYKVIKLQLGAKK